MGMKEVKRNTAANMIKAFFCFIAMGITSCNSNPKEKFLLKKQIGVCQEIDGMVTFEAKLYSDSTFYIPSNDLYINYSFGEFHIKKDTVLFITNGGETHLCEKYLYIQKANRLEPFYCKKTNTNNLQIFFDSDYQTTHNSKLFNSK
jgi:hypothetical protein